MPHYRFQSLKQYKFFFEKKKIFFIHSYIRVSCILIGSFVIINLPELND